MTDVADSARAAALRSHVRDRGQAPPLRDLQAAFARAIDGDAAAAATFVHGGALDAVTRLGIYANNVRGTFRAALELSYPAVRRIGGDEWFAGAARAYRRASPSRSGDIHPAAAGFPAFLAHELGGTELEALAELARLEWACEEAAIAADAPEFDPAVLSRIPVERQPQLVFTLHPSCRVVESVHPIVDLWNGDPIAREPQHALVHRVALEVRIRRLDAGVARFVATLAQRSTLAAALGAAVDVEPTFDLAATLTMLAREGVLVGVELDG
jgi:hypothetical protein